MAHGGVADVLDYWRRSLLDAAPAHLVPRQLAVIDWLATDVPPNADDDPALCMGDARLGNALLQGTDVRALVDFEVAYLGNPAADIGYCLIHERFTRFLSDRPASGIPSAEDTWDRWQAVSGRSIRERDYWTAFGATIMCVTGTRAMLKWGMPVDTINTDNIVIPEWEAIVKRAAG
jgi:aminoglycoside phosphotransferase (APT) family kinase protein